MCNTRWLTRSLDFVFAGRYVGRCRRARAEMYLFPYQAAGRAATPPGVGESAGASPVVLRVVDLASGTVTVSPSCPACLRRVASRLNSLAPAPNERGGRAAPRRSPDRANESCAETGRVKFAFFHLLRPFLVSCIRAYSQFRKTGGIRSSPQITARSGLRQPAARGAGAQRRNPAPIGALLVGKPFRRWLALERLLSSVMTPVVFREVFPCRLERNGFPKRLGRRRTGGRGGWAAVVQSKRSKDSRW